MLISARCPRAGCPGAAEPRPVESGTINLCPVCQGELVPTDDGDDLEGTIVERRAPADSQEWSPFRRPADGPQAGQLEDGSVFAGRYKIVRKLGQGGMAAVYLANDGRLDREVALKIPKLSGADETFITRFQREARAGAQLGRNRHICQIIDVGEADGVPYLTMDYVEGRPLSDLIQEQTGTLPIPDAVGYVRVLAETLGAAHALGIVHRDLKPSNVMIRNDGTLVLMDFGLARRETDDRITTKVIGTPSYMSPEQATGDSSKMGKATDIYSLGVILYELITGRRPFQSRVVREILRQIVHDDPAPPSAFRPELDPRLDALCLKAMAKSPADRHGSMAAFAAALATLSEPPPPPIDPGPDPRPARSRRLARVITATVLLAAALPAGWIAARRWDTKPPDDPTRNGTSAGTGGGPEVPGPATRGESGRPTPPPPTRANLDPVSAFSGMTFVQVQPGEFRMGSPRDEGQPDENPQHLVSIIRPFFLGRHEVTQGEYRKVTGDSPSHFSGDDRLPVEGVTWFDAVRFCNRLGEKDGLPAFYKIEGYRVIVIDGSAPGYRLPTEAEWEYACRAGLPGRFGFGDDERDLGEHAWFRENSRPKGTAMTQPVGGKKPNSLGLHDMQGNVWEWCWDWYADRYDSQDPAADPIGPASGKYRVLRGGTYSSPAGILRCAVRNQDLPESRSQCNGFRLARTIRAE